MNTLLEKLFEKYNFSEKDKYLVNQIFWLLPTNKQQNILNNLWILSSRLDLINREINLERRILVWDLFQEIETFYQKYWEKIWNL